MEKFEKEMIAALKDISNRLGSIDGRLQSIMMDNRATMDAKAKTYNTISAIIEEHKDDITDLFNMIREEIPSSNSEESKEEAVEGEVILRDVDGLTFSEFTLALETIDLKVRTIHALQKVGINSLGELCSLSRNELLTRLSTKMVDEDIIPALIDHGYKLRVIKED